MICLCFALDKEAAPFLQEGRVLRESRLGYATLYELDLHGESLFVLVTGYGKGFASSGLSAALAKLPIDGVLNVGVAGSLSGEKAPLLSAVISTELVQYDMDTTPVGDPLGYLPGVGGPFLPSDPALRAALREACRVNGIAFAEGRIASADRFLTHGDPARERIISAFSALCADMESAAYAQACWAFGVPYCALRVISDLSSASEYETYLGRAAEEATSILLSFFQERSRRR